MAAIPGTNVAAMVVPFDDQDIFATHNDKYGRGGYRVANTIAERDAITVHRRKEGMLVKVLEDGKIYELGTGETNADWFEFAVSGGGGAGDNVLKMARNNEDFVDFLIGTPVFAYSATGVRRAVANESSSAWKVLGLATGPVLAGSNGLFQGEGKLTATVAEWEALTGNVGGLVANKTYFLDPVLVGKITLVPPTADGEYVCRIGVAYSPTELYIDIGLCIKL